MAYIAFDSHTPSTLARVEDGDGRKTREARIAHARGAFQRVLAACESGSPVAVETSGNWYGMVDEREAAGCEPKRVQAHQAKLMMGLLQKTDQLDARGLNRRPRTGTLPAVWIPRGALRDQRALPRTRMVGVQQRTRLKNRLPATLATYGLPFPAVSALVGRRGRAWWEQSLPTSPPHPAYPAAQLLAAIDAVDHTIAAIEQRMPEVCRPSPDIALVQTLPGVGFILAVVMGPESGDGPRLPRPQECASCAGTTPRVHASGGKPRYGPLRPEVNRYVQWAVVKAANTCCRIRRRSPHRQVSHWSERLARSKGHHNAIGAGARHLAEAAYWALTKQEPYREPRRAHHLVSSTAASARAGELSPPRLDILSATRLRNPCMPREGDERPLARPERSARGQLSMFFFLSCQALSERLPMKA